MHQAYKYVNQTFLFIQFQPPWHLGPLECGVALNQKINTKSRTCTVFGSPPSSYEPNGAVDARRPPCGITLRYVTQVHAVRVEALVAAWGRWCRKERGQETQMGLHIPVLTRWRK